jgi:hypothetical protein
VLATCHLTDESAAVLDNLPHDANLLTRAGSGCRGGDGEDGALGGGALTADSRAAPGSTDRRSVGVNEGATESATTTAGMAAILMEQERQEVPPPPIRY